MSPAATTTREEDAASVLAAADDLFYRFGIGAVSMAQIRDAAGVSLRRLYSIHDSKTDLVTAWLYHRHAHWIQGFEELIDQHITSGSAPLDAVFDALADWMTATGFRGCGFINTRAETAELTPAHELAIRDHKAALRQLLARFIADSDALAVIVDGAIVQAAIFASTDPIDDARRAAQALAITERTS